MIVGVSVQLPTWASATATSAGPDVTIVESRQLSCLYLFEQMFYSSKYIEYMVGAWRS